VQALHSEGKYSVVHLVSEAQHTIEDAVSCRVAILLVFLERFSQYHHWQFTAVHRLSCSAKPCLRLYV